jgi:HTH-type transcriptional regulator / antitoxin HipB
MRTQRTTILDVEGIGAIVRGQRKRLGLTQERVAELANVGTRFISELENGKATVELGRVLQVLFVLGIRPTLEWVVGDEDP